MRMGGRPGSAATIKGEILNKQFLFVAGAAMLAMAGCTSAERQVEDAMRAELTKLGEVKEIDLTPQGSTDTMAGHAIVATANGDIRMECHARRTEGTQYDLNCAQEIDETVIAQTEDLIRTQFAQQGINVDHIDMQREGPGRMVGIVRASDGNGNSGEVTCTAVREAEGSTQFDIQCR